MDGAYIDWDDANIHVMTHGLHYGTAIFEGIRCYASEGRLAAFRMNDHYKRLTDGARVYRMKMGYGIGDLCDATKGLLKANGLKESYVRPIVFTGYGEISPDMADAGVSVAICSLELGEYFGARAQEGITCVSSSWKRMAPEYLSPHVKSSANYLNSAMAKLEARDAGASECILYSHDGHVAEASSANIFLVRDGELITPPTEDGILPGITRDSILEMACRRGIVCHEKSILRDELYLADEVFLCGTASEITPVIGIDRRVIGKGAPGPLTCIMREWYSRITRGLDGEFRDWLDFVE